VNEIPAPPPEPPDEKALAYLDYVGDAMARQIATSKTNGEEFPAFFLLPPPPRSYDLQLVQSFVPYFFASKYEGAPLPEIRFTSKEPDKI
jgi:hypothetical protein